jgi:hypothetical protein
MVRGWRGVGGSHQKTSMIRKNMRIIQLNENNKGGDYVTSSFHRFDFQKVTE